MKEVHYSIKFSGSDWYFHGCFFSRVVGRDFSFPDGCGSGLIDEAKSHASMKIKKWLKNPKDIVSFELYQYVENKEVILFKYEATQLSGAND